MKERLGLNRCVTFMTAKHSLAACGKWNKACASKHCRHRVQQCPFGADMAIAGSSRRRRWILRVQIIAPESSLSIRDQIPGRMKRTEGPRLWRLQILEPQHTRSPMTLELSRDFAKSHHTCTTNMIKVNGFNTQNSRGGGQTMNIKICGPPVTLPKRLVRQKSMSLLRGCAGGLLDAC